MSFRSKLTWKIGSRVFTKTISINLTMFLCKNNAKEGKHTFAWPIKAIKTIMILWVSFMAKNVFYFSFIFYLFHFVEFSFETTLCASDWVKIGIDRENKKVLFNYKNDSNEKKKVNMLRPVKWNKFDH